MEPIDPHPLPAGPSQERDSTPEEASRSEEISPDAEPLVTYHRSITDGSYVRVLLSPGFRFRPSDEDLISYYLNMKIDNVEAEYLTRIGDINIYQQPPDELADKNPYFVEGVGYFFSPRERKSLGSDVPNRAAGEGYWKTIGVQTIICDENNVCIGFKKRLAFYQRDGHIMTNWRMHEYVANRPRPPRRHPDDMRLDDCVLYQIFNLPGRRR